MSRWYYPDYIAEEQVLGIAMATRSDNGMSGLRAIRPDDFVQKPSHPTIASAILELADRGYRHDANAVSKLLTVRRQAMPWDFRGPLRQLPDGRQVPQPTAAYLVKLTEYAQPYETGIVFAAQVRDSYRKVYMAQTGFLAEQLGQELQRAAASGTEDTWDVTRRMNNLQSRLAQVVQDCPPTLEISSRTSAAPAPPQKTLTASTSLPRGPRPAGTRVRATR